VIAALEASSWIGPAGKCVIRNEDTSRVRSALGPDQARPEIPDAHAGELKVFPTDELLPQPPFAPVEASRGGRQAA